MHLHLNKHNDNLICLIFSVFTYLKHYEKKLFVYPSSIVTLIKHSTCNHKPNCFVITSCPRKTYGYLDHLLVFYKTQRKSLCYSATSSSKLEATVLSTRQDRATDSNNFSISGAQ